jgi:heparan-alpha-glucosaminide N-acetyltransferase
MNNRITSIDIFRALTMLLMIFVNDLWTLHGIPEWLEHAGTHEDRMGLADVVFPAFLFIVGLSIPFAIQARIKKGDSKALIMMHILRRTLALVVMGFFMVNMESYRHDVPEIVKKAWEVSMALAIILIWNVYEKDRVFHKIPVSLLQGIGIAILALLALVYKGGTPESPLWMRPHWWGILGLIGWAYLLCSMVYLWSGRKVWVILACILILIGLNVQEFIPLFKNHPHGIRIIVSASNHALVMSGVLATLVFLKLKENNTIKLFIGILLLLAVLYIAFGFATRPLWGISKNMATPSWTTICAGISFAFFALIYIITDYFKITRWANIIMPAGRSTLTCYLLPYIIYPLFYPLLKLLPDTLTGGLAGIVKSLIFALIIIQLTGLLERIKIKLRI